jgi:hypothetical protein
VLWIGARAAEYEVVHGELGEPLRQQVMVMYAFQTPDGKCWLHGNGVLADHVFVAREHMGGGHYGPPRVIGYDPMIGNNAFGDPLQCDAADRVKGGVHLASAVAPPGTVTQNGGASRPQP